MIFGSRKHKIVKENKYAGIKIFDAPKVEDIININRVVIFRPKEVADIFYLLLLYLTMLMKID